MQSIIRIPKVFDQYWFSDLELRKSFSQPQWNHFRSIVLAFIVTTYRHTMTGLDRVLAFGPHRTKRRDFVVVAPWDDQAALRIVARRTLEKLDIQPGDTIDLLVDDSYARKRGKKMQGVSKYREFPSMAYLWGHNFIAAGVLFKGRFVPYDLRLALKEGWCRKLCRRYQTLPDLAAAIIRSFSLAEELDLKVRVLFDAYYMTKKVVHAVVERGWSFFSTLPSNRKMKVKGRWTHIKEYRNCIPRCQYRAVNCRIEQEKRTFWATGRDVWLPSIGRVKVVFSRRLRKERALPLVTNERRLSKKDIIEIYSGRMAIECFFKTGKQFLGLGEYQTGKAAGIDRHLRLVGIVHSLLVQGVGQRGGAGERSRRKKRYQGLDPLSLMKARDEIRLRMFEDVLDYLEESFDPREVIRELRQLARAA